MEVWIVVHQIILSLWCLISLLCLSFYCHMWITILLESRSWLHIRLIIPFLDSILASYKDDKENWFGTRMLLLVFTYLVYSVLRDCNFHFIYQYAVNSYVTVTATYLFYLPWFCQDFQKLLCQLNWLHSDGKFVLSIWLHIQWCLLVVHYTTVSFWFPWPSLSLVSVLSPPQAVHGQMVEAL